MFHIATHSRDLKTYFFFFFVGCKFTIKKTSLIYPAVALSPGKEVENGRSVAVCTLPEKEI